VVGSGTGLRADSVGEPGQLVDTRAVSRRYGASRYPRYAWERRWPHPVLSRVWSWRTGSDFVAKLHDGYSTVAYLLPVPLSRRLMFLMLTSARWRNHAADWLAHW